MTMRIDVCITDPYTGAVVSCFTAHNSRFVEKRIGRIAANDRELIVTRRPMPKQPRVPLRLPSQRSPR